MQNIKMYSWSAWVNYLVQTVRTRPSFARMGALCCSNPLTIYPQANYMSVLLWIRTVTQPALKNSSTLFLQEKKRELQHPSSRNTSIDIHAFLAPLWYMIQIHLDEIIVFMFLNKIGHCISVGFPQLSISQPWTTCPTRAPKSLAERKNLSFSSVFITGNINFICKLELS